MKARMLCVPALFALRASGMLVEPAQEAGIAVDGGTTLNDKEKALATLDDVYEHHAKESHWLRQVGLDDREAAINETEKAGSSAAGIYGEVLPASVIQFFEKVGAKKGQKYYDLGAGHGKTVSLAYLMGLDATGVEVVTQRWDNACKALTRMEGKKDSVEHGPGLRFVHDSFLQVDFTDADIMFTDNLEFPPELTAGLAATAKKMRPGTKIISAKAFEGPEFEAAGDVTGPSSWSDASTWLIQTVKANDANKASSLTENSEAHKFGSKMTKSPIVCSL